MSDNERRICPVCGNKLPAGRGRYCSADCTRYAMGQQKPVTTCRLCGTKMYMKTADGLCAPCRELANDRRSDKKAEEAFELMVEVRNRTIGKDLAEWRETSRCYRCVYGRPLYDNVVFCNSAPGTCLANDQNCRIKEHTSYE